MAHTLAGATNLLWFSFHLCLAERNKKEAIRVAKILTVIIDEDTADGFTEQLVEAIKRLDEPLGNEYSGGDEQQNS